MVEAAWRLHGHAQFSKVLPDARGPLRSAPREGQVAQAWRLQEAPDRTDAGKLAEGQRAWLNGPLSTSFGTQQSIQLTNGI